MLTTSDAYVIPQCYRIARSPETKPLCKAEAQATEAIKRAAKFLQTDPDLGFWTEALPSELFTMLDTFDSSSSIAAALGFLAYAAERWPEKLQGFLNRDTGRKASEGYYVSYRDLLDSAAEWTETAEQPAHESLRATKPEPETV